MVTSVSRCCRKRVSRRDATTFRRLPRLHFGLCVYAQHYWLALTHTAMIAPRSAIQQVPNPPAGRKSRGPAPHTARPGTVRASG